MVSLAGPESSFELQNARSERAANSRLEALRDADLVRRFNSGDDSALREIMERHRVRIYSVAFALLKNRNDAEEIVQDTFIRAHRGLERFRGDCSLATWLHRIALNLARNRYWYFFRRRRHVTLSIDLAVSDDSQTTFLEMMACDAMSPVREALTGEFSDLIAACMERLGQRQREILILRNSLNHPYVEIARELGISIGTVKSRIARARATLRALLAENCPEFGEEAASEAWFKTVRPDGGVRAACA
ncbi:MAG: RNA polymerase sigma factor [Undibacterium sp.]|nr:RNA polymerase sigma factor [Opitutaceae bacterium]